MNATIRTAAAARALTAPAPPRVPGARRPREEYRVDGTAALRPQPTPAPDRSPPLRVTPPAPVSVPRAPFVVLVLVLVIGAVLGILLLNTKIAENAFRLNDLTERQAQLDRQEEQLERELADKASAGSLEAEANKLGLVDAGEPGYLRLSDGQVSGEPRAASEQSSVHSRTTNGGR